MSRIGAETIQVLRAALSAAGARYGTQVRNWAGATTTTVTGCSVQPHLASETTADREFTSTHLMLYAPYAADLQAADRVIHQGVTYDVDGAPAYWRDDTGVPSHLEASLKRLAG